MTLSSAIDLIRNVLFTCVGLMIGFLFGLVIGITGLPSFWNNSPQWLTLGFFLALSIGVCFLMFYFKREKIEGRKDK